MRSVILAREPTQRSPPSWYHAGLLRAAWAPLRALIAPLLFWACHAPEPGTPVGVSTAVPEPETPRKAEPPSVAWPDFEAASAWPEAAPPTKSLGHRRDGTLIRVRVEPPALEAYRALSEESPMPDGARILAWHESPEGQLLGGYLLEKAGGTWRASELDARGALVPGDRAPCIRCHDMAPTDHLFGLRAAAPPAVAAPAVVAAPPAAQPPRESTASDQR